MLALIILGKHTIHADVFEIIGWYWALEDEFHYPMTIRDHYSPQILHVISTKWSYQVNEAEYLAGDLLLLGAPIPKRRAINIDRNTHTLGSVKH